MFNLAQKNPFQSTASMRLALIIAMIALSSMSLLTDKLNRGLEMQAAHWLGAALVVEGSQAIQDTWLNAAKKMQLKHSHSLHFSSMVRQKNQFRLVTIKTVDQAYPLRGTIITSNNQHPLPKPGTIWLDSTLSKLFDKKLPLEVGNAQLLIGNELLYLSEQKRQFYAFLPTLLMHENDLKQTGILAQGSRLMQLDYFDGPAQNVKKLYESLKKNKRADQKIRYSSAIKTLGLTWIKQSQNALMISICLILALAGVCLAMHAQRFIQSERRQIALLRCIGVSWSSLIRYYASNMLGIILESALIGIALAALFAAALTHAYKPLQQLPATDWLILYKPIADLLILTLSFLGPVLIDIKKINPLSGIQNKPQLLYLQTKHLLFGMLGLFILIWEHSKLPLLALVIILSLIVLYQLLAWQGKWLIKCVQMIQSKTSPALTFAYHRLQIFQKANRIQSFGLSLTFAAFITLLLLNQTLLGHFTPNQASSKPNFFLINILPQNKTALFHWMKKHNIAFEGIYPMVRGRLIFKNHKPIKDTLDALAKKDNALARDLNLSSFSKLPENNQIVSGKWFADEIKHPNEISIEQGIAHRLHINIGDTLGFQVADQVISGKVSSIRSLAWDSMQPNFFMIFSKNVLQSLPKTYISSFHLPDHKKSLLPDFLKTFPSLTLLDLSMLGQAVSKALSQLQWMLGMLALLMGLLSLAVLVSGIKQNALLRKQQSHLLWQLGVSKRLLGKSSLCEYTLLALIIVILGSCLAFVLGVFMIEHLFALSLRFDWSTVLLSSAVTCLIIVAAAYQTQI